MKLSDIETQLAARNPDEIWGQYIVIIAAFWPFWDQAISSMAPLAKLPKDKAKAYRDAAEKSFELMNNWYFKQSVPVKRHRDEIDSAISFVRNTALRQGVAVYPAAAAARNLSAALRLALHMSVGNYSSKDFSKLVTSGLIYLAGVKSLFPIDVGDVVSQFALPGQPPSDNMYYFQTSLERGAAHFGLHNDVAKLYKALEDIWRHGDKPQPWRTPANAWKPQQTSLLAIIHYEGVHKFHGRGST